MKIIFNGVIALCVASMLFLSSCDDDPVIPNEEELITTLIWTLTPAGGGTALEFRFADEDGDGGEPAEISEDTLAANTTYNAAVRFLNESETPAEEITEEVEEEDNEHQVFVVTGAGLNLTTAYADMDGDGNPLGLATTVTTGDASTGTVTVSLVHEPDKGGAGVSGGDPTNAGGETDIEVEFDVVIQ